MPELPEVETTMRGIGAHLRGRRLTEVEVRRPDLRWPVSPDFRQQLQGARIVDVGRRAKYGLLHTDRGDSVILHLGMSGRMRIAPEEIAKHDHVIFSTDETRIALNDPRRFGSLHLVRTEELAAHPLIAACGPEPLSGELTADYLAAVIRNSRSPIKALLLDGRRIAGLGNIYVCEALFEAGVRPTRKGERVTYRELGRLAGTIPAVLRRAIRAGGSTLRDFAQPSGDLGYFQHEFKVYGREGEPCLTCAQPIRRIVQSGRSSFFCPRCQR
ncbi:DNA-formamidopyrimidine glycosylase [Pacificimonas flava]|uniref:Formamidopyrimidine-DNA glycosylase n=2 Tax=Pacificimonas TaxID=1960290 RepID=A0A219B3D7_9SPHN|nr:MULTISPECIES: bifunctional DNA-formamidopyrimidine glycosylase/DNA-(apurinic or apyrimidinic site) lyase [Pacificimonas]MBZ6377466.1 bifunctional DNA-formamidopyrimidine glycosylase/DNA-(apurinic or apyrimidinic site) lyase [Pacificimonas aurantium]OWV32835.1 DNA-formamidopyrimidine glycosylase [Pacificimonas flava]